MSEVDMYKGTLKYVEKINNETLEQQCKRILDGLCDGEYNRIEYYDLYSDALVDEFYEEYYVNEDKLYEIETSRMCGNDIFEGEKVDKDIKFIVQYYNGGCSLLEALDEVMKNVEDN